MLRATVLAVFLLCGLALAATIAPVAASPAALPVAAQPSEPCSWTGVWLPFEGEWRLAQNGTGVSGSYLDGKGFLSGTLTGNVLNGQWKEPPTYSPPFESGHFTVTMTADCSGFVGTWGLGDADCCNVLSAIRFEDAPPSLAVEVVRGALVVEGQTVPAGATYFPPNCPAPARAPTDGCVTFAIGSDTGLKFSCFVSRLVRVLLVLEDVDLSVEDNDLLIEMIAVGLREKCGLDAARQGDWGALDLAITQGAASVAAGENGRISMGTAPAVARLDGPGSFLAGFDPAAGKATFYAFAAPLGIEPQSAAAFTLPPYSRVEVTAAGAGPVMPLSRLYLPLQRR